MKIELVGGVSMMPARTDYDDHRPFATASASCALAAILWVIFFTVALGPIGWVLASPALLLSLAAVGLGLASLVRERESGPLHVRALVGVTLGVLLPAVAWIVLNRPVGTHLPGTLLALLWVIGLPAAAVCAGIALYRSVKSGPSSRGDDPEEILRVRLARGEIEIGEYERLRDLIRWDRESFRAARTDAP